MRTHAFGVVNVTYLAITVGTTKGLRVGVNVSTEVSQKQPGIEVPDSNVGHQDEPPTSEQVPSRGLFPTKVRPFETPKPISPFRATVDRWADAEDDDDFRVKDGTVFASSPGQVEVIHNGILVVEEALQMATGAFTEVGRCHRGRPRGRGNSLGVDASQTSCVNLEDIAIAVVRNRGMLAQCQVGKHGFFT
ncbi:hypothetical protein NE237_029596 [Protea cynaroides]|uniref:Uncharacterized protein n=1 Tax=Protea cynaroides TaxID=273540 RepID=A0A9Q0GW51_9MAGN|nr:hypothetical protein NE237_029596 [Protea cynaroides]